MVCKGISSLRGMRWDVSRAADGRMSSAEADFSIVHSLLSQFTITGYDASAHLSEETHNAAKAAPIGVLTAVGARSVLTKGEQAR